MPLFKIGDYVQRIDSLVPEYMKFGRVVRVIPNPNAPEHLTEYEVISCPLDCQGEVPQPGLGIRGPNSPPGAAASRLKTKTTRMSRCLPSAQHPGTHLEH